MILVEQGWPGLILWLVWVSYLLILAEKLWHHTRKTTEAHLVQAATMCMVFVLMVSLMNDLIETDKVGPLFYISAATITVIAIRKKLF
jgi:O-antigen ligase